MKESEYFIIFGGGGIRGLCYSGAYKALMEHNIKPTGFAGSSIGAVFASLIAVGYESKETYDILSETGFEMFIDINVGFKKKELAALSKGNIFLEWMREKIEKKYYGDQYIKGQMAPVTFNDIDKKLIIYSVDLTNLKFKEFSKTKTPDVEIATAVRASVSMPGLFTPLEYDDIMLVDGDLLKSTPLWRVSNTIKNLDERIIEFRLEDNEHPKKVENSIEYINRVYNAICGFATDYIVDLYNEKDKFDYIKINTKDVSVVDFLIPKEKKKELYDIGYSVTDKYFSDFFPKKREKLLNLYKNFLELLVKLQKELNKSNIVNSYLKLCEIFVFLCEEKQYIDSCLYEMTVNFKNLYVQNYKDSSFLGIKSASIKDKEIVLKELFSIIKCTSLKIDELS